MAENCCEMKKEIGSIFPLSDEVLQKAESEKTCFSRDRLFYSLCREALYDIAVSLDESNKKVLIPAYTCQTVITPFEEAGWQCDFFSIHKDLRVDIQSLCNAVEYIQPSLIVVHPYFGVDLNKEEVQTLKIIHEKGIMIVLDLTQCLFSTKQYDFATFIVASYRKWMPIPDGGFLINLSDMVKISQPEVENCEFCEKEKDAMYLRGHYFLNGKQRMKDLSIRLSKSADRYAENHIYPHKMSQVSYNLLLSEDTVQNQHKRFANYSYLFKTVIENKKISKVCNDIKEVTTAPLYFAIFVQDRQKLQRQLAKDSIYAPIIWPVEDEKTLINDEVKYIYNHLLAIPCDQRYDEKDMQRATEIINNFCL